MADITNVDQSSLPHNADIYWHYAGDPVQRSQLLGTFNIGAPQKVLLPIPADASIVLRAVPRGARGQTWMGGPGDATPVTVSALGVGTGGGTSNFYQQLRVNHGYSYGTTPTPRPVLNLLQSFQIKDDSLYGESDLTTFGIPTGMFNLKTDFNASGQGAVTTITAFDVSGSVTVAATLDLQPGNGILIEGAGISASNLQTTVTSVSADGKTYTLASALFSSPAIGARVQADDTVAVQNWINQKGDLAMPPGEYRLTSSIVLPTTSEGYSIVIHGSGWDLSGFSFQHHGDGFIPTAPDLKIDSLVFKDLSIGTGTKWVSGTIDAQSTGCAVRMTAPGYTGIYNNFVMQRCRVIGWGRWGIWSDNMEVSWISQCIFRENKSGHLAFVAPDTISPNKQPNANTITDTTFDQAISAGPSDAKRDVPSSMTAGSRTLNGSGFTSADRGKFIIVPGAATIGGDLFSFIDSVTDSTHVVLAHQAQFSSSSTAKLFPVNVASILLNRANDTVLDGSTIQGNFADAGSGATNTASDVNAIKAYNSANCRFIGIHEEDNAGPGGAAIRMENCIAMTIENWGGTSAGGPDFINAHGADFDLRNCHCVSVKNSFFNDRPQFVIDSTSSEIQIDDSFIVGYINLWQQDNSWDRLRIGSGVRVYQSADPRTNQTAGNEYLYDSMFGRDLIVNGRFLDGVGGNEGWTTINPTWWSNPYSSLTREGSYIRVDATAIASSTAPSTIFHQAVPIPDATLPGLFTLGFDWYLEAQNGVETTGYYVEVRLHPSSGIDEVCQFSTRRFSVVTGAWQRNQIRCFVGSGSARTVDVQINVTPGPNNVKIRFTNFRLASGKHVFGAYERAVHDFGGRMRAPLEMVPTSAVTYPPPPVGSSMVSIANIAGVLSVGSAGAYAPIGTGSTGGGTTLTGRSTYLPKFASGGGTTALADTSSLTEDASNLYESGHSFVLDVNKSIFLGGAANAQGEALHWDNTVSPPRLVVGSSSGTGEIVEFRTGAQSPAGTGRFYIDGNLRRLTFNVTDATNNASGPAAFYLAPNGSDQGIWIAHPTGSTGYPLVVFKGSTATCAIDDSGNIYPRNVSYVWPAAHAAGVLTSDASGNLSWAAGGGGGGISGTGTANTLVEWNVAGASLKDSPLSDDVTTNAVIASKRIIGSGEGTINFGDVQGHRIGGLYCINGVFIETQGTTRSSPHSFGFYPQYSAPIGDESGQIFLYGSRNLLQSGNQIRTVMGSYYGIELRGTRLATTGASPATGASTDPCVSIIAETTGCPVLVLNGATGTGSDICLFQIAGTSRARVSSTGGGYFDSLQTPLSTAATYVTAGSFGLNVNDASGNSALLRPTYLGLQTSADTLVIKAGHVGSSTGVIFVEINGSAASTKQIPFGKGTTAGDYFTWSTAAGTWVISPAPTGGGGGANTALSNLTATSINQSFVFNADGAYNIGDPTNRVGAIYLKNAFFVYTVGSSSGSPKAAGFLDPAPGEYTRLLVSGNASIAQGGNNQRTQFTSYHALELRGNRRSTTAPSFYNVSGTDIAGVIVLQDGVDSTPLWVDSNLTLTSDLLRCRNFTQDKFRVLSSGSIWSEGGIRNAIALIQPASGANVDLTNYLNYHVLILDTLNGSFTVTLPLLTATIAGVRWRLVCNRRTSTATVTVKCQSGNDINETLTGTTSGWLLHPNTNNARDAIVTGDYYNTSQWWLANLIV